MGEAIPTMISFFISNSIFMSVKEMNVFQISMNFFLKNEIHI